MPAPAGTGVEVTLDGTTLRNITEYTVVEDSTPLDPSDMTGGFGQITIGARADAQTNRTMNKTLSLTDGSLGVVNGTVRAITNENSFRASIQANSRTAQLAVERTIPPFIGTLGAALVSYLALCGITTNYVVDSALNSINVKLVGGRENVFDRIKKMTSAYGFEMSQVSGNIVFRLPRQRIAINYRNSSVTVNYDMSQLARNISAYNYNMRSGTDIVYPIQGSMNEVDIWQVNANETKVYTIQMDASLSAVDQPTITNNVGYSDMSLSRYTVSAADESILDPLVWARMGGLLSVKLLEDTTTLEVTIKGPDIADLSPFRIAMPLGNNDYYSSLRIRGTGVFWLREKIDWEIGENQDLAPDEVGAVVDSPFMETLDQTRTRMLLTAERYGTDRQTITVSTRGINRLGETGSAVYPTIGDLNALYPGATIAARTAALGPTIGDWNSKLFATVQTSFTNQAFGNVAGARVLYDNSWYRVRSATLRANGMDYTAERNNTIGDVYRTGETIGQWNTRWTGYQIRDVDIAPMRGL